MSARRQGVKHARQFSAFKKPPAAKDIDQLKASILNSDKLRELVSEHVRVIGVLAKEGDGLALTEVEYRNVKPSKSIR